MRFKMAAPLLRSTDTDPTEYTIRDILVGLMQGINLDLDTEVKQSLMIARQNHLDHITAQGLGPEDAPPFDYDVVRIVPYTLWLALVLLLTPLSVYLLSLSLSLSRHRPPPSHTQGLAIAHIVRRQYQALMGQAEGKIEQLRVDRSNDLIELTQQLLVPPQSVCFPSLCACLLRC